VQVALQEFVKICRLEGTVGSYGEPVGPKVAQEEFARDARHRFFQENPDATDADFANFFFSGEIYKCPQNYDANKIIALGKQGASALSGEMHIDERDAPMEPPTDLYERFQWGFHDELRGMPSEDALRALVPAVADYRSKYVKVNGGEPIDLQKRWVMRDSARFEGFYAAERIMTPEEQLREKHEHRRARTNGFDDTQQLRYYEALVDCAQYTCPLSVYDLDDMSASDKEKLGYINEYGDYRYRNVNTIDEALRFATKYIHNDEFFRRVRDVPAEDELPAELLEIDRNGRPHFYEDHEPRYIHVRYEADKAA